jgi:Tol biopolymer transport system component
VKFLRILASVILVYFSISALPLLFVYKDALFMPDVKKELSGKIMYNSLAYEGDIVIIELPARKRIVIPDEIYGYAYSPSFSPEGKQIMFRGKEEAIYIIDSNGENLRRLLKLNNEDIFSCSYSPDGSKFAFITRKGLYVGDINMPYFYRKILNIALSSSQPAWSPDNRKLAVVTDKQVRASIQVWGKTYHGWKSAGEILTLNIDGSDVRKLIHGFKPSWSPDGKKIAYQGEDGYYIIDAYDTDGSTKRLMSSNQSFFKSGVSVCARWSPDGKYITVGKKLWFYTDGVYVVSVDNPKKMIWIAAVSDNMNGMSWVR